MRTYTDKEARAFNVLSMVNAMANDSFAGSHSFELEVLGDYAARNGLAFNPTSPRIPIELIATRDMSVAGVSGSQYLTSTDTAAPSDILRPVSVTVQAGVTVIPDLKANVAIPLVGTAATGHWLGTEHTAITETQPVIGQASMTPKTVAAFLRFSKQLSREPAVEPFLRSHLVGTIGQLVDQAVLNGSGVSGEPQGLFQTPDITSQSGTSLTWESVLAMKKAAAAANGEASAWIGTPATREILEGREKAAGSGFIWDDGRMAGIPAFATMGAPVASLCCGPWSSIVLGLWGDVEVTVDPYTSWNTGVLQMRVMLHCDVAVLNRQAFVISATVT